MRLPRTTKILGAFLVVAVATALSLSMDFRAAQSASDTSSTISKITFGTPPLRPEGTLVLHVAGDGELRGDLEKALIPRLEKVAGIADVRVLGSMPSESANPILPVLVVEARRDASTWTPAYASASIVTRIVYASDGDLSWQNDKAVVMGRNDGLPQLRMRGDLTLGDTTRGVISRPAYQRHLAQQIASAVSDTLKKQVYGSS